MHPLKTSLNGSLAFSCVISGFLQFLQRAPWLFKPVYHQLSALYIHNFIRIHDPDKIHDFEIHDEHIDIEPYGELAPGPAGRQEIARGTARRDIIAQSMWESYVSVGITNAWAVGVFLYKS